MMLAKVKVWMTSWEIYPGKKIHFLKIKKTRIMNSWSGMLKLSQICITVNNQCSSPIGKLA